MRTRLSKDPIPAILTGTNSRNLDLHAESFLLDDAIAHYGFEHWRAHMFSFFGRYPEPNYHVDADRYSELQAVIVQGLEQAGFSEQGLQLRATADEASLNRCLVRQYTTEGPLYHEVNRGLRGVHAGAVTSHPGLIPWMLQFNAMLRLRPAHYGTAYRGTDLTDAEIDEYRTNEFFVWASFISASRTRESCLDGNVLFELSPFGAISEYEKRDSRDLSQFSVMPEEQEVIFPLCCAFRVREKSRLEDGVTLICVEVVDCA